MKSSNILISLIIYQALLVSYNLEIYPSHLKFNVTYIQIFEPLDDNYTNLSTHFQQNSAIIKLYPKSIKINSLIGNETNQNISKYIDFSLIDGEIFFKLNELKTIKTHTFNKIIDKFSVCIQTLLQDKTIEFVTKYCYFALNQLNSQNRVNQSNILTAFCFDKYSYPSRYFKKFKAFFLNRYLINLLDDDRILDIQNFSQFDLYKFKYFSSYFHSKHNRLSNNFTLFTTINREGIFLSQEKNNVFQKFHKFSFRFEQMYNCLPTIGRDANKIKEVSSEMYKLLPPNECCITIEVDWIKRPVKEIICSIKEKMKECKIEIKQLQATIYKNCARYSIKELFYLIQGNHLKTLDSDYKGKFRDIINKIDYFKNVFKSDKFQKKIEEIQSKKGKIIQDLQKENKIIIEKIHKENEECEDEQIKENVKIKDIYDRRYSLNLDKLIKNMKKNIRGQYPFKEQKKELKKEKNNDSYSTPKRLLDCDYKILGKYFVENIRKNKKEEFNKEHIKSIKLIIKNNFEIFCELYRNKGVLNNKIYTNLLISPYKDLKRFFKRIKRNLNEKERFFKNYISLNFDSKICYLRNEYPIAIKPKLRNNHLLKTKLNNKISNSSYPTIIKTKMKKDIYYYGKCNTNNILKDSKKIKLSWNKSKTNLNFNSANHYNNTRIQKIDHKKSKHKIKNLSNIVNKTASNVNYLKKDNLVNSTRFEGKQMISSKDNNEKTLNNYDTTKLNNDLLNSNLSSIKNHTNIKDNSTSNHLLFNTIQHKKINETNSNIQSNLSFNTSNIYSVQNSSFLNLKISFKITDVPKIEKQKSKENKLSLFRVALNKINSSVNLKSL